MARDGRRQHVAYVAGVAELRCARLIHAGEDVDKPGIGLGVDGETLGRRGEHAAEDFSELLGFVVAEIDLIVDARGYAVVDGRELAHLLGVAGHDEHELAAAVLGVGQQALDGFEAEGVAFVAAETVGLVDE